jgi:hypothetical protein
MIEFPKTSDNNIDSLLKATGNCPTMKHKYQRRSETPSYADQQLSETLLWQHQRLSGLLAQLVSVSRKQL